MEEDSLDLLLDTLCNTFGAIILITLLIVIISNESETNREPEPVKDYKNEWILENQMIARIKDEIVIEKSISERISSSSESQPEHILEAIKQKDSLLLEKENLIQTMKLAKSRLDMIPSADENLIDDLNVQLIELRNDYQKTQNDMSYFISDIKEKEQSLSKIDIEITNLKQSRSKVLRLPKEKARSRKQFLWVIVKYGKIYPCDYEKKEDIFNITQSMDVLSGNLVFWYKPKLNRGFDPNLDRRGLVDFLNKVNKNFEYLAFEVFPKIFLFKRSI